MSEKQAQNTAITFLTIAGVLLILANKSKTPWQGIVAIVLLILLSFGLPWLGLVLAIPICFLVYIKNTSMLSAYWTRLKNIKISNA